MIASLPTYPEPVHPFDGRREMSTPLLLCGYEGLKLC